MSEKTTRVYELGYLLIPTTPEGEVATQTETITKAITAAEGTVVGEGAPDFIDLAYQMEQSLGSKKFKWNQGYFGWIKFEMEAAQAEALKKALDANTTIIRYILLKTSVENTVVFKKPKLDPKRESLQDGELIDEVALEEIEALEDEEMKAEHEKLPDLESEVALDQQASTEA